MGIIAGYVTSTFIHCCKQSTLYLNIHILGFFNEFDVVMFPLILHIYKIGIQDLKPPSFCISFHLYHGTQTNVSTLIDIKDKGLLSYFFKPRPVY